MPDHLIRLKKVMSLMPNVNIVTEMVDMIAQQEATNQPAAV